MKNIFEVGDKVFHIQYGWGEVCYQNPDIIRVDFTISNITFKNQLKGLLSFTEYKLEGFTQERPEKLPNKGDIVWVRDYNEEDWAINHYFDYETHNNMPYVASMDMTRGSACHYAQMRTTNPYTNESTSI